MKRIESPYRTHSLYAAAFLLASEFPLIDTERTLSGRVEFVIGGAPDALQRRLTEYRSGSALVNVQRFSSELRRLKAILHGGD